MTLCFYGTCAHYRELLMQGMKEILRFIFSLITDGLGTVADRYIINLAYIWKSYTLPYPYLYRDIPG